LAETGSEMGSPPVPMLGAPPWDGAIDCAALSALLNSDDATVVDVSLSPAYRKAHIAGAWFAIRSRLSHALAKIPLPGTLVLTSEDGALAGFAAVEARALTTHPVRWLKGGNAAWQAAGLALSDQALMADDALDVWLKPYERPGDPSNAMNEYLSWEVDLLARIARDGTCKFQESAATATH